MEHVLKISNINNAIVFRDNDIYAIQERADALELALKTLGVPFVIEGCVVSGTAPTNAVSAGKVFIDGRTHTLPAIPSIDLSTIKYIKFLSSNDSDPRALSGGGTQNRIKTYLAQVSATDAVAPLQSIAISQEIPAPTFSDIVVKTSETLRTAVLLGSLLSSSWADDSVLYPLSLEKSFRRKVRLSGRVKYNGGGNSTILTLSSQDLLPANPVFFAVPMQLVDGTYTTTSVAVLPDGIVKVLNPIASYSADVVIHLSSIQYSTIFNN
jgi:hypothetical protein